MGWLTIAVLIVLVIIPSGWPMVAAIGDSAAWRELAVDGPRLLQLAAQSLALALCVVGLAAPTGVWIGCVSARLQGWGWVRGLLIGLLFTPIALIVGGWRSLTGPSGPLSLAPTWLQEGAAAVVIVHALIAAAGVALAVGLAVRQAPAAWEEAGRLDGSTWSVLRRITLPSTRAGWVFAAWWTVVGIWTEMTVTDLLGPIRTLAEETYTEMELTGNARPLVLLTAPFALTLAVGLALTLEQALTRRPPRHGLRFLPTDRSTLPLRLAALLWATVVVGLVVGLIWQLGWTSHFDPSTGGRHHYWSLATAMTYLQRVLTAHGGLLVWSMAWSAVAGGVTLIGGGVLGMTWLVSGQSRRRWLLLLTLWPALLPGPTVAFGLVDLLNRPGWLATLYDSPFVMIYGQVIRSLPIVFVLWIMLLSQLGRATIEAAHTDGANDRQLLLQVLLPAVRPHLRLVWLTGSALALGELPLTKTLAPPGSETFVVTLFSMLHRGAGNEQAAMSLILALVVVGTVGLMDATRQA